MKYLLGIDFGGGASKATLLREDGVISARCTTEYKTLTVEEHVNLYIEDGKSSMDAIKIVAKERGMI